MDAVMLFIIILFGSCFGIGLIVSRLENKKGWVEGHIPKGFYERHIKRPLDFALALFATILFWPLLLIIGIAVRMNLGSPVVFTQERPGLGGEIFKIKKFRTMTDDRDADGNLLPDGKRLTKFGKFLRASSVDEGLELLNILKGDISIVGPRPLLTRYLPYYSSEEMHRHDVRPGLTGLSQVHGRNYTPWQDRFGYDLSYVNNITFIGDIKILLNTVKVVLLHIGVVDRTQIQVDENGDTFIAVNGVKHKYPKPLDVERMEA